jgi:Transcriptional regulator, contains sigma factor-related N-terminal domain
MKYEIDNKTNTARQIIEKGDKGYKKSETGYWVRIPEKWWRGALSGLRPVERCIMVSLRVWGARKPTKSQLARELGVSRLTIIRTFKKLRKKGIL